MDVFLSYAAEDRSLADTIVSKLQAHDITFFCAHKSLQGGAPFKDEVRAHLNDCAELFVLITEHSIRSQWVTAEWGAAWALQKRVTPILYRCGPRDLPDQLRDLEARDLHDLDRLMEEFVQRRKDRLSKSLISLSRREGAGSAARYFIGMDVGRGQIDYSVLDCECLARPLARQSPAPVQSTCAFYRGARETPASFEDVYPVLADIVDELSAKCLQDRVYPLSGIGVGLPGMVNPSGMLVYSPSFHTRYENFTERLRRHLRWDGGLADVLPQGASDIPILIDNDVRCATRWHWLTEAPNVKNLVCVFVGNGLGSGIVTNGKMLYGKAFLAGEAGHTTIATTSPLFQGALQRCHCEKEGLHWEMHVCRYGFRHIWATRDAERAGKIADERGIDVRDADIPLLSELFYQGDPYTGETVDLFLEHLAIGLGNYIYVLNPERVVLGGGMIRAFYSKTRTSPFFGQETTHQVLQRKIGKYVFPQFEGDYLVIEGTPKQDVASLGAALIFRDPSHPGEGVALG